MRFTRAQYAADFHETTHGRYSNLVRLLSRITTTWRNR